MKLQCGRRRIDVPLQARRLAVPPAQLVVIALVAVDGRAAGVLRGARLMAAYEIAIGQSVEEKNVGAKK